MVFQAALGSVANAYLRGAMAGWAGVGAAANRNGLSIGDFNALRVLGTDKDPAQLMLSDLVALEKALKELSPELHRKYKRDVKKLGKPTLEEMQRTFSNINIYGPLGPVTRRNRTFDKMATSPYARLSWYNSVTIAQNKAIDINYKNRNSTRELNRLKAGRDGTLSIVRIRIHAPAFIIADIAGASGKARSADGKYTRYYSKLGQGGMVYTTRHKISSRNVDNWLRRLNNSADKKLQSKPSRYAWPTMERQMPKFRRDTTQFINETIIDLNKRLTIREATPSITKSSQSIGRRVAA